MIGRICTRSVHIATPGESIFEAARRMREADVGTLVVVNDDGAPVGMLSDRDIALRCVAEGLDPERTPIEAVMTAPVRTTRETTPIEDALQLMAGASLRRLVVIDAQGSLVGLLALDDVLELLAEEQATIGRLLRARSRAPAAERATPGA